MRTTREAPTQLRFENGKMVHGDLREVEATELRTWNKGDIGTVAKLFWYATPDLMKEHLYLGQQRLDHRGPDGREYPLISPASYHDGSELSPGAIAMCFDRDEIVFYTVGDVSDAQLARFVEILAQHLSDL